MIDALHISESGLQATQKWIDQLSNNVANMHTPGYKKTVTNFSDLVAAPTSTQSTQNELNVQAGLGTSLDNTLIDFSEGTMKFTGRELDIAINGIGFIEVISEDGSLAYTRFGGLVINEEGYLTTVDGHVLSDDIQVPPEINNIEISNQGQVIGRFSGEEDVIELGQIQLARLTNSGDLMPVGNGLFKLSNDSARVFLDNPGENGAGEIMQGTLEMSNVSLVDEMTNLVLAQRAYQLNARIIQTADQVLETINNLRR